MLEVSFSDVWRGLIITLKSTPIIELVAWILKALLILLFLFFFYIFLSLFLYRIKEKIKPTPPPPFFAMVRARNFSYLKQYSKGDLDAILWSLYYIVTDPSFQGLEEHKLLEEIRMELLGAIGDVTAALNDDNIRELVEIIRQNPQPNSR